MIESWMKEKNLMRCRYCKCLSYFSRLGEEREEQGERSGETEDRGKRRNKDCEDFFVPLRA